MKVKINYGVANLNKNLLYVSEIGLLTNACLF